MQTRVGDVIGWRNLFWAFTESMARDPKPWIGDTLIPKLEYALTYRMFMIEGYPRMKEIIEQDVASGLIDLPSSAAGLSRARRCGRIWTGASADRTACPRSTV